MKKNLRRQVIRETHDKGHGKCLGLHVRMIFEVCHKAGYNERLLPAHLHIGLADDKSSCMCGR